MDAIEPEGAGLATERIACEGLAALGGQNDPQARATLLAEMVLQVFDDYYARSRRIPWLAKRAFETRDWPQAIALSQERIAIFSAAVTMAADILGPAIREAERSSGLWRPVETRYGALIAGRYEGDLALAFLASLRRAVHHDAWTPIPYDFHKPRMPVARSDLVETFWPPGRMTPEIVARLLAVPEIEAPFADRAGDAAAVAARINAELGLDASPGLDRVEVLRAGFYRNRGAYVVGSLEMQGQLAPLALALEHGAEGVRVDAVILRETTLRHVFSSTLANFHVTEPRYHELVDYLFQLMPARPRGQHYSTIGYNHVGKMAIMAEMRRDMAHGAAVFDHAPGPRGSVAIGFTAPATDFVAKVIRDTPTDSYKWERWDGVEAVLERYRSVHELNRSGSMLDNVIYHNVALPRALFGAALLDELMEAAAGSVTLHRDDVFFRHLIVQRKVVPVPIYLAGCTREEAELVVIRLGQCIRNNAATNVFNRDLDGRNYGVSSLRFVYLFDYDAILTLTDVKVRTNADREAGEEDIPDWVFEDGPVFLPEEMEAHLRLPDRGLRRLFREAHGELLTARYWQRMQRWLSEGRVPRVRTYPRSAQLDPLRPAANLAMRRPG